MSATIMNSSLVDDFIKTHRTKLTEEKSRMKEESTRAVVGILPNDEGRTADLERRRKEMKDEYVAYIHGKENYQPRRWIGDSSKTKTISDIRQEMQTKREKEIDFGSKERRDVSTDNHRTGRTGRESNYPHVGVAKVSHDWNEEEKDLHTWAIERGNLQTSTRSPPYHKDDDLSSRSISAPVVGLARLGFGHEEDPVEKRQKQLQYRYDLMEQMKERNKDEHAIAIRKRQELTSPQQRRQDVRRSKETTDRELYRYNTSHTPHDDDEIQTQYHSKPSRHTQYPPPPLPYDHTHTIPYDHTHPPSVPYTHLQYDHTHPPYPNYYPYYYPPYPPPHPPPPPRMYYYDTPDTYSHNPYLIPVNKYTRNNSPPTSRNGMRSPPISRKSQKSPVGYRTSPKEEKKEVRWRDKGYSRDTENSAAALRAILDQQVREKKEREKKEKNEKEKLYRRIDAEAEVYDPWGKPGAGAPLTDPSGNIIAERGQMRKSFDGTSPRLSEEERKKMMQEKQREELEEQIRIHQEKQMKDKLQRQKEDEDEEKRLKDECERLNIREKKEFHEEMKRKNEEKNKEIERPVSQLLSKQELAEQRLIEELEKKKRVQEEEKKRLDRLADKMASEKKPDWRNRSLSPPIPALRNNPQPLPPPLSISPPVPAIKMGHSLQSDITPQITTPTTHQVLPVHDNEPLPQEPHNIDHMTDHVTDHITFNETSKTIDYHHSTSDVQIIPHKGLRQRKPSLEVLQGLSDLKNHIRKTQHQESVNPMPIRMKPSIPRYQNKTSPVQHFNQIKYSKPSDSRVQFWREYPHPPRNDTALEIQQDALIRHQRKQIENEKREGERGIERINTRETSIRGQREGGDHRRRHWDSSPTSFTIGSALPDNPVGPRPPSDQSLYTINTLDIDTLATRNEERARRLEAILNANDRGTRDANPRSVLDNFMKTRNTTKRNEGIPYSLTNNGSETSLDCETTFQTLSSN